MVTFALQFLFSFRFLSLWFSPSRFWKKKRGTGIASNHRLAWGMDDTVGVKPPECSCFQDIRMSREELRLFFLFLFFFSTMRRCWLQDVAHKMVLLIIKNRMEKMWANQIRENIPRMYLFNRKSSKLYRLWLWKWNFRIFDGAFSGCGQRNSSECEIVELVNIILRRTRLIRCKLLYNSQLTWFSYRLLYVLVTQSPRNIIDENWLFTNWKLSRNLDIFV